VQWCEFEVEDGSVCADPIELVEIPNQFVPGVSNCCRRHRCSTTEVLQETLQDNMQENGASDNVLKFGGQISGQGSTE